MSRYLKPSALYFSARRCESWKFELPPSTKTSPLLPYFANSSSASSVTSPAGTIDHSTRGALSFETIS